MYRNRVISGLNKKPIPAPLNSSEKSLSLPICQNDIKCANSNFTSSLFGSLPIPKNGNTSPLVKLSQKNFKDILNENTNIIFNQNDKHSENSPKKLNVSQQSFSQHDNQKVYGTTKHEEKKIVIEPDPKCKNLNKKQRNLNNNKDVEKSFKLKSKFTKIDSKNQKKLSKIFNENIETLTQKILDDNKALKLKNGISPSIQKRQKGDHAEKYPEIETIKRSQKKLRNQKSSEDNKTLKLKKDSTLKGKNQIIKNKKSNQEKEKIKLLQRSSPLVGLSQPSADLTHRERLEWLRDRRGVGTWIQCCNHDCSKWRYEPNIKDPINVPEKWFCYMNSDVTNLKKCDAPECPPNLIIEEDLIHNKFTAGSIVWAHLKGFPWWPAMVDDCPDTEQYYWLNDFSDIPTHYHVVFFDETVVSRSWIKAEDLEAFKTGKEHIRTRVGKQNYNNRIKIAKAQALESLQMDIPERLKKYGFLTRWNGPINTPPPSDSDDSVDENDNVYDLDTLMKISQNLSDSSYNDTINRNIRKTLQKHRKRKVSNLSLESSSENISEIFEKQSKSLLIEINVSTQNTNSVLVTKKNKINSSNIKSNELLINSEVTESKILCHNQITNELQDVRNTNDNEIPSIADAINDIDNVSLRSLFNSDDENFTADLLTNVDY